MADEESDIESFAPWVLLFLTIIGGFLRLLLIDIPLLGMGETFSMWISGQSLGSIAGLAANIDQQPPLYYFLFHIWLAITRDTPYFMRLFPALLGTATIPMIYLIGKRLSGELVGLAAAALLAVSPFSIRFAQEISPYTLLMFNASVAICCLTYLLTDPRSTKPFGAQFKAYLQAWRNAAPLEPEAKKEFSYAEENRRFSGVRNWFIRHRWLHLEAIETDLAWIGLVLFSAATMLSHNTALLFLLAANLFVLGLMLVRRNKISESGLQAPSVLNWVFAQVVILLLWSPWIPGFIQQTRGVLQGYWIPRPGWDTLLQAFKSLLNYSVAPQPKEMIILWALYAVVAVLGLVYLFKKASRLVFLAVLFLVPLLGELVLSLRQPIFLDRTLIWLMIPLFLLLAVGIARLKFRFLILVVIGIFCTINLFSISDNHRYTQAEDWFDPAGNVAYYVQDNDLILFNNPRAQIPFDYYYVTYVDKYSLKAEEHGVPVELSASGLLEPKMTESDIPALLALLQGHKRVWFLSSKAWNTDPDGLIPQTLASQMQLVGGHEYPDVVLQVYAAP